MRRVVWRSTEIASVSAARTELAAPVFLFACNIVAHAWLWVPISQRGRSRVKAVLALARGIAFHDFIRTRQPALTCESYVRRHDPPVLSGLGIAIAPVILFDRQTRFEYFFEQRLCLHLSTPSLDRCGHTSVRAGDPITPSAPVRRVRLLSSVQA